MQIEPNCAQKRNWAHTVIQEAPELNESGVRMLDPGVPRFMLTAI